MCLALITFGIMNVYSVEPEKGIRQLIFFGLSIFLITGLIVFSSTTPIFFEIYSPFIYLLSILLLVGVLLFGREINGAKAWFDFGFASFQPVEVAKLSTGLLLANYISSPSVDIRSRKTSLIAFSIMAIPIALVMLQPDLGSVLVFSAFIVALYREGFSILYIFIPVLGGALFLLSINFPAYFVLVSIAFLISIVSLFLIAFNRKRKLLRTLMGIQLGLIVFYIVLILLITFFPENGTLPLNNKGYIPLKILYFNVYFYSGVGLLIAILLTVSISYFFLKDSSESPFKTLSTEFAPQHSYETGIISAVLFICVICFSVFSSEIYAKLPAHQQERVMVLFEGESKYRETSGYNLLYSKTAIGSGDLSGKGYLQGTIKIGRFVPEQSTDFIFCTVGEEWGFIGSSILIVFYGLFIIRIFYLAETQKSKFSRFFGYSIASIFLLHYSMNIAMVMGLFMTVGIPLPFFSYGGSSLWSFITLLTVFLILNYKDKQSLI